MRFGKPGIDGERCLVLRAGGGQFSIRVKQIAEIDACGGIVRMPAHGLLIRGARSRTMTAGMSQRRELLKRREVRGITAQYVDVGLLRRRIFCPGREPPRALEQR